ncbi:MAG TPA: tRNA pseudouridine(38-40) synthase TruA [Bacteroidia bacterium]|nr:tRNA pseudouridine(38-40) synthase TruA [Bacteroidia bacterium]
MQRYFLRLSYKGSGYAGWQLQENATSVQEKLNAALSVLIGRDITTTGCGRTDTGVHATCFYAHLDLEAPETDPDRFIYKLNAILPNDIAVQELLPVTEQAHARFDARKRTYEYLITHEKNPFLRDLTYFLPGSADIVMMNKACKHLLQTTDFTCFSKTHSGTINPICTISHAVWEERDGILVFTISANRFLRGMVRAVVGTLLQVGNGRREVDSVKELIASGDRSLAGASVPACGLYLCEVEYPYLINPGKATIFEL